MTAPNNLLPVPVPAPKAWRRTHPLTILLKMSSLIVAFCAFGIIKLDSLMGIGSELKEGERGALIVLGISVIVVVVYLIAVAVKWQNFRYRLTGDEVGIEEGLIGKRTRTASYDKIQGVDIAENVVARLTGMASVVIETAGGSDSRIEIQYLPKEEAKNLRDEILLAMKNGGPAQVIDEDSAADSDSDSVDPTTDVGTVLVSPVPIMRSLAGAALSSSFVIGLIIAAVTATGGSFFGHKGGIVVPVIFAVGTHIWNQIDNSWKFSARLVHKNGHDTVDISYGLADRRTQSIRLSRIHALEISQPFLWRYVGWWKVKVSVAGYGKAAAGKSTDLLLPVGTFEEALAVLSTCGPLDEYASPAQPQAEWTARRSDKGLWLHPFEGRCAFISVMTEDGALVPLSSSSECVPFAVVIRRGRINRRAVIVAASHIQELTLARGPVAQKLGQAGVKCHLVTGEMDASVTGLPEGQACQLFALLGQRKLPKLEYVDPVAE